MLKEAAIHFCQFEEPHFSNRTCRIEESVTIYHGPSVSVIANIIGNMKSIFLFRKSYFGKNCIWSPCFFSSAELFSSSIPGKTTS